MEKHAMWRWVMILAAGLAMATPLAAQETAETGSPGAAVVSARFLTNLEQAKAAAAAKDLKILVDFYTDW
jgi:hypothetical protein